jgi:hypothetical protein
VDISRIGNQPGNGSTYSGTVTVERNGDTFLVRWTIAGSRQIGVGIGKDVKMVGGRAFVSVDSAAAPDYLLKFALPSN